MIDIKNIINYLKEYDKEDINLMEVCGTHTATITRGGIESLISPKIHLISGPGCPVCVTVSEYIDKLCEIAFMDSYTVVTFSDMLRVKGGKYSLSEAKAMGGDVIDIYTPFQILKYTSDNEDITYVFDTVVFETTSPIYALLVDEIIKRKIDNIKFLTSLKVMPPAIEYLCETSSNIDGFIAPGHVSVITGADIFIPIAKKYSKPFVVSGFEVDEILASIYLLVKEKGKGVVKNLYKRAVKDIPNKKAQVMLDKYFEKGDGAWRGLGVIKDSGVYLKEEYSYLDMGSRNLFSDKNGNTSCKCADVLSGRIRCTDCPLFGNACTPDTPIGACMVSSEGACFNYYKK